MRLTAILAQATADDSAAEADGLLDIVFAGGATGVAIVLVLLVLSMAALALAVEHLLTIRRDVLTPPGLADTVRQKLRQGDRAGATQSCQLQPSFLAGVIQAALADADDGWPATLKALEDAAGEHAARLFRKIEYLSVIGNIAPMIGLLGTVVGMIFAFQEVANSQGAARAAELAGGIYQALVTTVGGLLVAIPSLAMYAVFRNWVDGLVTETAHTAQRALRPLKDASPQRQKTH